MGRSALLAITLWVAPLNLSLEGAGLVIDEEDNKVDNNDNENNDKRMCTRLLADGEDQNGFATSVPFLCAFHWKRSGHFEEQPILRNNCTWRFFLPAIFSARRN